MFINLVLYYTNYLKYRKSMFCRKYKYMHIKHNIKRAREKTTRAIDIIKKSNYHHKKRRTRNVKRWF